jgi:hypothetical protein
MVRTVTAVTCARNKIAIPLSLYLSLWLFLLPMAALSDSGDSFGFKPAECAFTCRFCSVYDASISHG